MKKEEKLFMKPELNLYSSFFQNETDVAKPHSSDLK
jgi:hypothetical protein